MIQSKFRPQCFGCGKIGCFVDQFPNKESDSSSEDEREKLHSFYYS